jgi:type IV pilus assembly protein PilW
MRPSDLTPPRGRFSGAFSLVELMVATAIGGLLIAGTLRLFVQYRAAWQTADNLATLEERAAFALTALEEDVRLAGFRGRQAHGTAMAGLSVHCAGRDISSWALDLDTPVAGDNGHYGLPCPAFTTAVTDSDTLILRHARPDVTSTATRTEIQVHAWYLDQSSSAVTVPSLRRYALVDGGLLQNQEIIPGVEDFQVELGVDRDGDGIIDGFVTPDAARNQHVLAVRFQLVVRSALREPGSDTIWRRQTAERTVWLRNQVSGG